MDWNALRWFFAIARTGSLSKAALQLNVNHSTIYRRLKALENDLGGRVFQKIDNRYVLTTLGENLLEMGKEIEEGFERIERGLAGTDQQPRGAVRITAPPNIASHYLPKILEPFSKLYPQISIEIFASNMELNLNNRQADIAVRATSSPPEHLVGHPISQIPWSIYASQLYLDQYGIPESPMDLEGHRLIGACGALLSLKGFQALESKWAEQIVMRCDDLTSMAGFAEYGHGLALLPNDQERDGIQKLHPFPPAGSSDLWLLVHPELRGVERIRLTMLAISNGFKAIQWEN